MDRTTLSFNIAFMAIFAVVLLVLLVVMTRPASCYRRADAMSVRLRLPYGTAATRDVVAARSRRGTTWALTAALIGLCAAVPFLATPLAREPYFLLIAVLPCIVLPTATANVVINLRERLFHPAPDVPRIARLTRMRSRDYLGSAGARVPWVLAGVLAFALVAIIAVSTAAPGRLAPSAVSAFVAAAALTLCLHAARPFLDRLVLDRPQPAADTLELAWDDAFRTETLRSLALAACQLSGIAIGMGAIAIAPTATLWAAVAMQLPTWGAIVPQFVYVGWNGRPLQPALYPDWLRAPAGSAVEGSAA
ncbi:hypothetical protein JNB62_10095 [Microbacterium jejuense]|uniref:Uncharacterized protein n=1 Tax=Microbacterium jejuense TaxID=1263637 RepID=A0ABS7HMZ8_9MICO|nr:hypothetical protein [Microbacterium jejuense]MBW9094033.1 hypothetical protein [Microbacterium jejuense]